MPTMRVGVDLDGVTHNFVGGLRAVVSDVRKIPHYLLPVPRQWNFWTEWGLTFEEWKECFDEGVRRETMFAHGGPLDHGIINRLHETHSIHIVTHRPDEAYATTKRWLREHGVRFDSLTFSEDKTSVPTDVFIDDRPKNVAELVAAGCKAVLFDQPWNRGEDADGLHRIYSWREFRDYIKAVGG